MNCFAVALVGRVNVGKSTLFNRLVQKRLALTGKSPALTRDRRMAQVKRGGIAFLFMDTAGFAAPDDPIVPLAQQETQKAILDAGAIVFVVDAQAGLLPDDLHLARLLRHEGKRVLLAANKAEGMENASVLAEFSPLGFADVFPVSALHGLGVGAMLEQLQSWSTQDEGKQTEEEEEPSEEEAPQTPMLAIVGRENAGKSTLANRLLGEARFIVSATAGTTREALDADIKRGEKSYTLMDTPGFKPGQKKSERRQDQSACQMLLAIEKADVVLLLLDPVCGIGVEDARMAKEILQAGRALVLGVNKTDALDDLGKPRATAQLQEHFRFLPFCRVVWLSAKKGVGMGKLLAAAEEAVQASFGKYSTPRLTRLLLEAQKKHPAPRSGLFRPKLRFAHQGGKNPPTFVIHGSGLDHLSDGYKRYLESDLRESLGLWGVPIKIIWKNKENPYNLRGKKP